MITKRRRSARVYLTTVLDEATARALEEGADERRMSLSGYTREVLAGHFAAQRETDAKQPQDTSY
jgi:hypothetical protein